MAPKQNIDVFYHIFTLIVIPTHQCCRHHCCPVGMRSRLGASQRLAGFLEIDCSIRVSEVMSVFRPTVDLLKAYCRPTVGLLAVKVLELGGDAPWLP